MSWFDKLFGEDNGSNDDYLNKRSQRRQKAKQQEKRESLLPQNNDVYERPKGKFRFPVDGLESEQAHKEQVDSEDKLRETQQKDRTRGEDQGERVSVNHPHRRRRTMHESAKAHTTNDEVNSNVAHRHSSYEEASREKKQHHGKRMRIQTDVLRANTHSKANHQAPKYHQSEFKASEVPSAIFGTKKPRPLQNGVIPPTSNDTDESDSKIDKVNTEQSTQHRSTTSSTSKDTQQTVFYNDQYKDSNVFDSKSNIENNGEHKSTNQANKSQEQSKGPKNNTINIENIYASQIVEEIRKERERKLLQKRQFKKALQQKRQQKNDNHEDSIQNAINEMYAKQAKHHLGESSLDDLNSYDESQKNGDSSSEEVGYSSAESDIQNAENHSNNESTSLFNYEEIDLDNISDVHTANQSYQQIDEVTEDDLNNAENHDSYLTNKDDEVTESIQAADLEEDDSEQNSGIEHATNQDIATSAYNDLDQSKHQALEDEIVDAQYRELVNENDKNSDDNDEIEHNQELATHDHDEQPTMNSVVDDTDYEQNAQSYQTSEATSVTYSELDSSSTSEVADADITSTSELDSSKHLSQLDSQSVANQNAELSETTSESNGHNNEVKSSETIDNVSDNPSKVVDDTEDDSKSNVDYANTQQENVGTQQAVSHVEQTDDNIKQNKQTSNQSQHNAPLRKGGKPFNVVMTPSDKKRMMDAKKSRQNLSASRMNQQQNEQTVETQITTDNVLETSEANTQFETVSNSTSENNQHQDINLNQSDSTVSEPTLEPESAESLSVENQTRDHSIAEQTDDKLETSLDNEVLSESNQVNQGNTEIPPLQPEFNKHQQESASNTEHQDDYNEKPVIRRGPNIKLPSPVLLEEPEEHEIDNSWIEEKKQELNEAFYYFNVPAEVQNVTEGPSVTRFELSVEKGVKVSRITALQDDIKMALAAKDIRIEAPIPGTSLVGIEVPNQSSTKVNLRSIIDTPKFKNSESKLTVAMGYRINNEPLLMDIAKTPHALIAGATGSGKSVCINSILMSLLYKNHPEELRLLLIDPKMVELAPYNDLPHLVSPVITDVKAATQSLKWAVEEMERRYKVFAKYHVRNITAFNKKAAYEDRMPKIVIVIDELADLMMMAPQEVEQSIARIAQKARACGIHMLVATQRPSVNVITGLIKANIPTRIAFMVSSSVDSRTILDSGGAERLLGYGDMLYLGSGMNKPIRVQGTFVSDEEIDDVVDFIKQQREPEYLFEEKELLKKTEAQPQDDLFNDVCRFMLQEGHISTSLIQRHFQIGYNRAARIIDQLEQLGYVSGANGSKPRDVYITEADLNND